MEAWLKWHAAVARLSPGQPKPAEPTTVLVLLRGRRGAALVERGSDWDPRVATALEVVKPRAAAVVRGLASEGVQIRGASCLAEHAPGSVDKGDFTSVDLRIRKKSGRRPAGMRGLVEAKWSRWRLSKAKRAAKAGLAPLRKIRKRGRWCGPITAGGRSDPQPSKGKRACAPLVGSLCVCRGKWRLELFRGTSRTLAHCSEKRIQARDSGYKRRQAAKGKAAKGKVQQVPALGGPAAAPPAGAQDSEQSESDASSLCSSSSCSPSSEDEHDGYSTDSD